MLRRSPDPEGVAEDLIPDLPELWEQQELCDVTLLSADKQAFRAHKIILAGASRYFQALFVGGGRHLLESSRGGAGETSVELEAIDSDSLTAVLESIYRKRINVHQGNVQGLLMAANYLDVPKLQQACCQHLYMNLQPASCLETLELAAHAGCRELYASTLTYVRGHFEEVMSERGRAGLQQLQPSTLLEVLSSDELEVQSERQVLEATVAWCEHDPEQRKAFLPKLLAAVRLPPAELQHQMSYGMPQGLASCLPSAGAPAPGHWACSSAASAPLPQPRRNMPTGLLAAGGHDKDWRSLKSTEFYDPTHDVWSTANQLPEPVPFAAYTTVKGNLFVVPGAAHKSAALLYARQAKRWWRCEGPKAQRVHAAMASIGASAYILGGRTSGANNELRSVETACYGGQGWLEGEAQAYGYSACLWEPRGPMCHPRTAVGAASLGTAIYAVGGQCGKEVHQSAEVYCSERDEWQLLQAPMISPRKYHALRQLGGRLYAVGGMTSTRQRLPTVEAYDPREGRWAEVAPMSVPRSSCGAACLHGRLYVVGGNAGDETFHASVEAFCPEAGRWQPCASLSQGRSSLALAAV